MHARIVELTAPRRLRWRSEHFDPQPLRETQLLCETMVSVISPGTELGAYVGLPPLRPGPSYPRLQGYCNVARVLAVGTAVHKANPGDRVLSFNSHRSHFVMEEAGVLHVLPSHVTSEEAACAYLYHLGYNAVLRADVRAGSRVLVIGLGVLGLTSVAMATLSGADVTAVSDQNAQRGLAFGARAVFRRNESASLDKALGHDGADTVIVTTSTWADWALAMQHAGMRGTIAVLGFPGRTESPGSFNPLDSRTFYAKQLRIESVGYSPEHPDSRGFARYNERANMRWIIEQIAARRVRPAVLISGRYSADCIEQAYEDLLARKHSPVTYALLWNQD